MRIAILFIFLIQLSGAIGQDLRFPISLIVKGQTITEFSAFGLNQDGLFRLDVENGNLEIPDSLRFIKEIILQSREHCISIPMPIPPEDHPVRPYFYLTVYHDQRLLRNLPAKKFDGGIWWRCVKGWYCVDYGDSFVTMVKPQMMTSCENIILSEGGRP